jgi:hypothetical protein
VLASAQRENASVRSGSVSPAAQFGDGAQHSFACALVSLNERIRAEDSRNFCSLAVLVNQAHGDAINVRLRKQGKVLRV